MSVEQALILIVDDDAELAAMLVRLFSREHWATQTVLTAGDAERALYDSRVIAMAPHVEQDPRIVMITYNDETLFNTGIRSPLDRTLLTTALANIDAMGGAVAAIAYMKGRLVESNADRLSRIESGATTVGDTTTNARSGWSSTCSFPAAPTRSWMQTRMASTSVATPCQPVHHG